MQHSINITTLADLPAAAQELVRLFPDKKIFAFYGEMGAGKTTFITALCKHMGVADSISSPTFSIVNEYESELGDTIYHFDFYRIKTLSEAYDLGYEDYFYSQAFCFIEWPEKIEELLPEDCVKVTFSKDGDKRTLSAE